MLQQRGCGGTWGRGLPSHGEGRRQQIHDPGRGPNHSLVSYIESFTCGLHRVGAGGAKGAAALGAAALGAAEATGPERRKEVSGEKTKIPEKKTQTRQALTSLTPALCPVGRGATGRAQGAAGRQQGRKDVAVGSVLWHCQHR